MITKGTAIENAAEVRDAILARIEEECEHIQPEFLSRWTFGKFLDVVARIIDHGLRSELRAHSRPDSIGVSLIYGGDARHYLVGGSSTDRRTMERISRYYDVVEHTTLSYTAYAIRHNVSFVLDDFKRTCEETADRGIVTHGPKACELEEKETHSYFFVPLGPQSSSEPRLIRRIADFDPLPQPASTLPETALRISSSQTDVASFVHEIIDAKFRVRLYEILRECPAYVQDNRGNEALAIADLQTDLLQHRRNEYDGLEALAFHIQALYEDCECSIFIAHDETKPGATARHIKLRLAATTAMSSSRQHKRFRRAFFDENAHYSCYFQDGKPVPEELEKCAKTERAFYEPHSLTPEAGNAQSKHYPGYGEIEQGVGSFLALAIPGRDREDLPHGIIRIVRESKALFNDEALGLAAAIARALTYWLDFFPKSEALDIAWSPEDLEEIALRKLFDLRVADHGGESDEMCAAELEFKWLAQKIFAGCTRIEIDEMFPGRSGAIALRVKNDARLDLILKCNLKTRDAIIQEIQNYRTYIEGKLPLNHNVIYPDLVRETRRLVGFGTSFLDSRRRDRVSLTQFCKERRHTVPLEWTLTRVVERIVNDVWEWWYRDEQMSQFGGLREAPAAVYVEEMQTDPLFAFLLDMNKFNHKVLGATRMIGRELPSELWEHFGEYLRTTNDRVTWNVTVTHGDIHGDNIFFDPDSMEVWLIDFGRTGPRASIFDLALLESDLKFRHFANMYGKPIREHHKSVQQFQEFERALASQATYERLEVPATDHSVALRTIGKLVVDIRQLACQRIGRKGSFRDYQIALLLLAFKHMKLGNASMEQRALAYLSARTLLQTAFPVPEVVDDAPVEPPSRISTPAS